MGVVIGIAGGLAIVVFLFALYFFPLITAWEKKHKDTKAIGILNFFLGWTFLGWIIALVWAYKK